MEFLSVFNDVLGPVMPGPSSSHTAGSYRLGRLARSLLGGSPRRAVITFDPGGSYGRVYRAQGVDLGFAAGLLGWSLTDRRFSRAASSARRLGLDLSFRVASLPRADHPNFALLRLGALRGHELDLEGESVGGGAVRLTRCDGWPVDLDGKSYVILIEVSNGGASAVRRFLARRLPRGAHLVGRKRGPRVLVEVQSPSPLPPQTLAGLGSLAGVGSLRTADPVFFLEKGQPLFQSAADIVRLSRSGRVSLGRLGLAYEAGVLGLGEKEVLDEMVRRYEVMVGSVRRGLSGRGLRLKLLAPSAARVLEADSRGRLAVGGLPARAAARALAVMHVANSGGTVCAAPTGGSAGVLPAAVMTLAEDRGSSPEEVARGLFAASAVGLVVARRATFAAETAGCQVEIGAAGAMASAAVMDMVGGTAAQACDAAAISLQNTMGSVCDLVQGLCEIPCHTRNAAAAASAYLCADLVLGGYRNPIPLDETIDASFASGRMLPAELRCTARGGLALAPSARALNRRRSRPARSRRSPRA
jgi:L-serine dehydratase